MGSQLTDAWRQKYPKQYDDLSDEDLEAAILSKHPEYKDLATPPTAKTDAKTDDSEPFEKGNIDLSNRPRVKNADGSTSTVRSMSFGDDQGNEILVPTVVNGKVVSDKEAIDNYRQTGQHLGKFKSVDAANKFAQTLHESEAKKLEDNPDKEESTNSGPSFLDRITSNPLGEIKKGYDTAGDIWKAGNTPLSLAPTKLADTLADPLEEYGNSHNSPLGTAARYGSAFVHNMGEFGSGLTSPIGAASMLLPGAGSAVSKVAPEVGAAIAAAGRAINVPFMLHGAHQVLEGETPSDKLQGLLEGVMGYMGARGHMPSAPEAEPNFRSANIPADSPIDPLSVASPDMVPQGAESNYNSMNAKAPIPDPIEAAVERLRGPRDLSGQNPLKEGPDVRDEAPKGRVSAKTPLEPLTTGVDKPNIEKIPLPTTDDSTAVKLYKAAKGVEPVEETVPVKDLVATQSTFRPDVVDEYTDGTRGNDKLPEVMEYNGKYYISDGHHNILSELQGGATDVKVKNTPVNPELLPPDFKESIKPTEGNIKVPDKSIETPPVKADEPPVTPIAKQLSDSLAAGADPVGVAQKVNQTGRLAGTETQKTNAWRELANVPRSLMTSYDISGPGRQGLPLALNKEYWTSFNDMFKSWGSDRAYQVVKQSIFDHPNFQGPDSLAKRAGLRLSGNEEQFQSHLAEMIPGVAASERAYNGFLGKLRSDTFNRMIDDYRAIGRDPSKDDVLLKSIGTFINDATGRGSLGPKFEKALPALSDVFFAPRLVASRVNMYKTLLNPLTYAQEDPIMRQQALKSLLAITGIGQTIGALGKYAGGTVSNDSTSPDFGKLKVGNSRIDPYAGFQQYAVAASRILSGRTTSSTSNKTIDMDAGKFGQPTRADIAQRFVTSKLAPIPSFVFSLLSGKNFDGTSFNAKQQIAERMIPLAVQDLMDIWKQDPKLFPAGTFAGNNPNLTKSALSVAPVVGFGAQTYGR